MVKEIELDELELEEIEQVYKENVNQSVAQLWDKELEDDNTETGGVSFSGETLGDFLLEAAEYNEVLGLDIDGVNVMLKECGIKEIA